MSVEPPVLYLVEFKMGDYGPCAECYTFYVNDDHPITIHNRIMAFSHPCWVSSHPTWVRWVLAHADCTFTKLPDTKLSVPTKIYAVIDFPAALETVKHKDNAKTDNLLTASIALR